MKGICPACCRRVRLAGDLVARHLVYIEDRGARCPGSGRAPYVDPATLEQDPPRLVVTCGPCPAPDACNEEGRCIFGRRPGRAIEARAVVVGRSPAPFMAPAPRSVQEK